MVRRSESNRDALKLACQINEEAFIIPKKPIEIRWNSIHDMIGSILRIKEGLTYVSFRDSDTWGEAVPGQREFEVISAVYKCLHPFKKATKIWERSKEPNLHEVVKQLWNIRCALEDERRDSRYAKMFAGHLLKMTEKRFKNCGTSCKLFAVAHYLDPDMRGLILKEFRNAYDTTITQMRMMCLKYDTAPVHISEEPNDEVDETGDDDKHLSGAERLKKRRRVGGDRPDNPPTMSRFDLDVQNYEMMTDTDTDYANPLKWFLRNKSSYPILSKLAEEILPVPASSSSSERAFSSATKVSLTLNYLSNIIFKCFCF